MTRRKSAGGQTGQTQTRRATGPVDFQIEGSAATNAFVLHIEWLHDAAPSGQTTDNLRSGESRLAEAVRLARAIDLTIVGEQVVSLTKLKPSTLLGKGRVEDLALSIAAQEADLVVVNAQLSPAQQRNLERAWNAKVLDRTGLILEIFGRRARTREGTLQVELAHLVYQKSRLVRSWTHLERQRGGSGFLGGPGETQLEADRRVIQTRITKIKKQLATVSRTRGLHRHARTRVPYPVVALVGYTNAGKSTLFNRLTGADVDARDLLFATLDPTMRQINLPRGRKAILSDTVGFISDLPTTLVAAFRATLEEVCNADIILHVRDISHPETDAQSHDVHLVLEELGLAEQQRDRMIEVWNKVDLLDAEARQQIDVQADRKAGNCCIVSAASGEGTTRLLDMICERLAEPARTFEIGVSAANGADAAWLYRHGDVLMRVDLPNGDVKLRVSFAETKVKTATERFGKRMRSVTPRQLSTKSPIAAE